ncbi:MAG: metalloregulator ArsR/SmtB family transcription factor [Elusimicrobiota bacterium]
MEQIVKIMKALADKTRLRIINLMLKSKKPLCICEIMHTLQLAQYNVSKHMKELKSAGLVTEKRDGKFIYYSLIEPEDKYLSDIFSGLAAVPEKTLAEDKKRLCCTLKERIKDKCCGLIKGNRE